LTTGIRTLVLVLDALAENKCIKPLCRLFVEAEKSNKAYRFIKPLTKKIIDRHAKTSS